MSSVDRASDAMNAPLRREYNRILHLLKADPEAIESRHAIGLIVAMVKGEPRKYGKQAVSLLSAALGRDEATLYRFAQVAGRWTSVELAQWLERGDVTKHPLSWWHFVEASAVAQRRVREELLRRLVDDGLSVRALASAGGKGRRPYRAGNRLLREAGVLVRRTKALREYWENLQGSSPEEMRPTISRELIERAKEEHAELVVQAHKALESIEALCTETHLEKPQS